MPSFRPANQLTNPSLRNALGHSLLKRKSEALTKRFREITRRIDEAKRKMGRVMQIAAFSLAEVTYATGGGSNLNYQVQESVKTARFRVRTKQENVSGVLLPAFESYIVEGNSDFGLTGLGRGGQQVQKCREVYGKAVETLVELASLQASEDWAMPAGVGHGWVEAGAN